MERTVEIHPSIPQSGYQKCQTPPRGSLIHSFPEAGARGRPRAPATAMHHPADGSTERDAPSAVTCPARRARALRVAASPPTRPAIIFKCALVRSIFSKCPPLRFSSSLILSHGRQPRAVVVGAAEPPPPPARSRNPHLPRHGHVPPT